MSFGALMIFVDTILSDMSQDMIFYTFFDTILIMFGRIIEQFFADLLEKSISS